MNDLKWHSKAPPCELCGRFGGNGISRGEIYEETVCLACFLTDLGHGPDAGEIVSGLLTLAAISGGPEAVSEAWAAVEGHRETLARFLDRRIKSG